MGNAIRQGEIDYRASEISKDRGHNGIPSAFQGRANSVERRSSALVDFIIETQPRLVADN